MTNLIILEDKIRNLTELRQKLIPEPPEVELTALRRRSLENSISQVIL